MFYKEFIFHNKKHKLKFNKDLIIKIFRSLKPLANFVFKKISIKKKEKKIKLEIIFNDKNYLDL